MLYSLHRNTHVFIWNWESEPPGPSSQGSPYRSHHSSHPLLHNHETLASCDKTTGNRDGPGCGVSFPVLLIWPHDVPASWTPVALWARHPCQWLPGSLLRRAGPFPPHTAYAFWFTQQLPPRSLLRAPSSWDTLLTTLGRPRPA